MSSKTQFRVKMALYAAVLILAELLQTSVFGQLDLGINPCVMPVAVACIGIFEGPERGCIFGLAGGCLWAWATALTMYGAWCIVSLTAIGFLAGLITERFLLRGLKTALSISIGAVFLTDGLYVLTRIFSGRVPFSALLTSFVPECILSLVLCLLFYAIVAQISRIGGFHG